MSSTLLEALNASNLAVLKAYGLTGNESLVPVEPQAVVVEQGPVAITLADALTNSRLFRQWRDGTPQWTTAKDQKDSNERAAYAAMLYPGLPPIAAEISARTKLELGNPIYIADWSGKTDEEWFAKLNGQKGDPGIAG